MKLYTEEQVRRAMADSYIIGTDREDNCLEIEEYIRKNLTPIELPSDEEIIGRFMNWFLKHYSTATIDGFFGYVNALEEEVSIKEILDDYLNQNK